MNTPIYKYHGTGNDFILMDNRAGHAHLTTEQVRLLCDRRFGVGGDGLMQLQSSGKSDFEMVYYNSDGREGSMCGNGGRCIVAFAYQLGIIGRHARFTAIDGAHEAEIIETVDNVTEVKLRLNDVCEIQTIKDHLFINTGSPHYMLNVENVQDHDVITQGRRWRYDEAFAPGGTNVNFVEPADGHLFVRTFERGVEDETYSCGTGVTAAALAQAIVTGDFSSPVFVKTKGGDLKVYFNKHNEGFSDIWLQGPATFVFKCQTSAHRLYKSFNA